MLLVSYLAKRNNMGPKRGVHRMERESRFNTKFKNALEAELLSVHHDTKADGVSEPSILSTASCFV